MWKCNWVLSRKHTPLGSGSEQDRFRENLTTEEIFFQPSYHHHQLPNLSRNSWFWIIFSRVHTKNLPMVSSSGVVIEFLIFLFMFCAQIACMSALIMNKPGNAQEILPPIHAIYEQKRENIINYENRARINSRCAVEKYNTIMRKINTEHTLG